MTQPENSQYKKLRVIIADDIQETRRNTRLMLATIDGIEVVDIVADGLQAVESAKIHHPDIVFLDINMPKMDGLTAYKEILKMHPDTGCVILSAEKDTGTLRTAMAIGVQEYLIKPFTVEELEEAVARVHKRVELARVKLAQDTQVRKQREAFLQQLATEYAKNHRTDDKAVQVFEYLTENPECDPRWVQNLAMIYTVRKMWGKLKVLAERAEQQTK